MPSNVWRCWTLGVALIMVAGCADEATAPAGDEPIPPTQEVAEKLTCRVNVASGSMECGPRAEAPGRTAGAAGGPQLNLIVGSQHQFVRLANSAPVVDTDADTWRADVTVQNLTLQPMGTPDGEHVDASGVRVFFVDEPSNGVEVVNYTGTAEFTGSESRKFYAYEHFDLGEDWVLDPGEVSESKTWEFKLNGQTEFEFSVLVSATVPDPNAYRVRLSNVGTRDSHVCAEGDDGKIYCWGYNQHGQLGDGSTTPRTIPVPVHAPLGVTLSKVWVGYHHTCALDDDGKAYCWGRNNLGQLGDGTTTDSSTPVEVELPQNVRLTRIVAGRDHTCGDASDGSVYCWGATKRASSATGRPTAESPPCR